MLASLATIDTVASGEDLFGRRVSRPAGSGSGVVVSADGYIVTNNHVVTYQGQVVSKVLVTLDDKKTMDATIVGRDPRSDLAVLKVDRTGLTPIEFGDSDKLVVGQWVIAAGNPLGYSNTISAGIISSLGRQLPSDNSALFVDGIQTDAAINMGNSGGPLGDEQGRLVGINVAIASLDGGSVGIGFAIPVNRVRTVVSDIIKYGHVRYGVLGMEVERESRAILSIDRYRERLKEIAGTNADPPKAGAIVSGVDAGSAAAQAGIKPFDVVTSIDGKPVQEVRDYQVAMANKRPGEKVSFGVWSGGTTKTVQATLKEAAPAEESF